MNPIQKLKAARLRLIITSSLFLAVLTLRAGQTNSYDSGYIEARGAETNGIYGMISIGPDRHQMIYVEIGFAFATNDYSPSPSYTNTNPSKPFGPEGHGFIYYMATNSFCGPIELRDATGKTVPMLKPELNSPESYPDRFNIWIVSRILETTKSGIYRGPFLPMPVVSNFPVTSFYLKDYFKVEKPGKYQLTIWPKIYKWISPKSHLCERIDIPPVTIPIQWKGKSQEK